MIGELAPSDSGDKPVRAPKDLIKRLRQVLPAATAGRLTDSTRAAVIYGIRRRRPSEAAGPLPPNQPEIVPPDDELDF